MPGTTAYPAELDTFPEIGPNTSESAAGTEHDVVHANEMTAIAALQAKVGVDGSADPASLDARMGAVESGKLDVAEVGVSVASLVAGQVPASQLPSFVDDVLEYADRASFPATGESGKIYVAVDSGKTYRWSGSDYIEISPSPGSTDGLVEGSLNLYFTAQRVRDVLLAGLSTATNAAIAAGDSLLAAFGKLQAQLNALFARQINTTAPLTGGGDLSANRTLGITEATTAGAGSMSATDKAKLDTIAAGATAYSDAAARAAVISSTIAPGDTTHAPSGDAVNTALAGKAPLTRPQFTDWVGIGTPASRPLTINSDTSTLPGGEASMLVFGSANNERIEARSASGDPTFQGKASLGTIAAPLAIEAGKSLVTLAGSAHNGLFWITGNRALLRAQATETWSSTANGCEWLLATTPNGSSAFVWRWVATHDGHWAPYADNFATIGIAGNRIKEIHCANSVINTSDAREKTPLRPLDDTELAIARDIAGIVGIYQWLAAVAEKGEDGARLHCGAIAQQVIAAFEAHGRDAFRYGIACYDAWPETREPAQYETVEVEPAQTIDHPAIYERTQVYTAEGMPERFAERLVSPAWTEVVAPAVTEQRLVSDEVIHPAGDRYSLRYGELAMFLHAGTAHDLAAAKAELAALSDRVQALEAKA